VLNKLHTAKERAEREKNSLFKEKKKN
jgi:hypothetical protein